MRRILVIFAILLQRGSILLFNLSRMLLILSPLFDHEVFDDFASDVLNTAKPEISISHCTLTPRTRTSISPAYLRRDPLFCVQFVYSSPDNCSGDIWYHHVAFPDLHLTCVWQQVKIRIFADPLYRAP